MATRVPTASSIVSGIILTVDPGVHAAAEPRSSESAVPAQVSNPQVLKLLSSLEEMKRGAETLRSNYGAHAATIAERLRACVAAGNSPASELSRQYAEAMLQTLDVNSLVNALYRTSSLASDLSQNARLWLDDRHASWHGDAFLALQAALPGLCLTNFCLEDHLRQLLYGAGLRRENGVVSTDNGALAQLEPAQQLSIIDQFIAWCDDQIWSVHHLHKLANS